jgi:hypothetical protein
MRRYIYDIWQPLTLLVITTSLTAAFFTKYDPYSPARTGKDWFFCNADGNLEKTEYDYRPFWDPRLYFTINIAFGEFSFSTVKIIDAAWDAVVGRGGQLVAAVVAYRMLRRSLTLTMESCTVSMSAITSLYCQQIQLIPVGQLLRTMFWHWSSVHTPWQQAIPKGRARLGVQLFACIYVLSFATLVSITTGYRAQLTGYSSSGVNETGLLFPINQLVEPRFALLDGARVGLSDTIMYAHDTIQYPDGVLDWYDSKSTSDSSMLNIGEFLDASRDYEHPYGVLLDCQ